MKKISIILYAVLISISISGCRLVENTQKSMTEESSLLMELPETVSELPSTEEMLPTTTAAEDTESIIDQAFLNHTHNIYTGTIGETEIRMKISRIDNVLLASYITREDEERTFEGEILNLTDFELKDTDGGYWKGTVKKDEAGIIRLSGAGVLSGKNIEFMLGSGSGPETYMTIGEDFDNYYSENATGGCAEEIEKFARQIKGSINDRESFIKLFDYPITIYIDGEPVFVQNEEEMAIQYDKLIVEDDFREQIEHMYTKYLFKNYLGVCVERGILWFSGNEITALSYRKK